MEIKKILLLFSTLVLLIIAGSHLVAKKTETRRGEKLPSTQSATTQDSEPIAEDNEDKKSPIGNNDIIRVLLNTTGYESLYHKSVKVTSSGDFQVMIGEKVKQYPAKEVVSIKKMKEKVIIKPQNPKNKIQVLSIKRGGKSPSYRGNLELRYDSNGILIINELSMDEYLYGVLPSEMPAAYETEALKAQAICARSYAMKQKEEGRYEPFFADVDDSVQSQVYNNSPEDKRANEAVLQTKGQVVTYEDNIINAYFFSTSGGHTTNATDVWYEDVNDVTPVYLKGGYQGSDKFKLDLRKEKEFRSFINNTDQYDTFEKEEDWYRWNINTSLTNLQNSIEKADESYKVGTLKNLKITKRGVGGVAKELVVTGSKKTITIEKEYDIRLALAPLYDQVFCQNKKVIDTMTLLPSGYFYLTVNKGKVSIAGGGFGHGVGMSQNGANSMAMKGYTAAEIIQHYFPKTTIKNTRQL